MLGGPILGARLLRQVGTLDEAAGRALQRLVAVVLTDAPPHVLVDLSAVETVTVDGVAALVRVAESVTHHVGPDTAAGLSRWLAAGPG